MDQQAHPTAALHAESATWVPLRAGVAMRPLRFEKHGYALQLKVEPGTTITRHRHTGEVHALNISGYREVVDSQEILGPGDYLYEPPGNTDTWRCYGDAPCIVHISLTGRVEYLNAAGEVENYSDTDTAKAQYLEYCAAHCIAPDPRVVGG